MKSIVLIIMLCLPLTGFAAVTQITVPVTLTYQGHSVQAVMAVDTGATHTTIGARLSARLGIPTGLNATGLAAMADGRAVEYRTVIMDVSADILSQRMPVNIMEYAGSAHVDGLLGLDFLGQLPMLIDCRRGVFTWIRE